MGTAFGFSVAALRYYANFPKWVLILGILVVLADMFWSIVLNIQILQWITVALLLSYTLVLGVETRQAAKYSL